MYRFSGGTASPSGQTRVVLIGDSLASRFDRYCRAHGFVNGGLDPIFCAAVPEPVRHAARASRLAVAVPATSTSHNVVAAASDDGDQEDVDVVVSGLLGGKLYTPLATYNVVHRPLWLICRTR